MIKIIGSLAIVFFGRITTKGKVPRIISKLMTSITQK
jgi:hypothetical protein